MARLWKMCCWTAVSIGILLGMSQVAWSQGTHCAKPNVLLLLNKSSNMMSKWTTALQTLAQIVPNRASTSRFGLMPFDSTGRISVRFSDNALPRLAQTLATMRPSGRANHRAAFSAARSYILQELSRDTSTSRPYIVILITDANSSDGNPNPDIAGLRSITSSNGRTKDVKTYVLAISPAPNAFSILLSWARTGGTQRPYTTQIASSLSSSLATHEPKPRPEQCNGQDDDCDGTIDEGLQRFCTASCPGGTSGQGQQKCTAGKWGTCVVQRRPETCNGRDDDCNGLVDDKVAPLACQTRCGTGVRKCVNGRFQRCSAPNPTPEVCGNNKDDDCDGLVDELCQCKTGDVQACGTDKGECKRGKQTCEQGKWSTLCVGETAPTREICDNKDNDCDGIIDDNVIRSCSSACGRGVQRCSAGAWGKCNAPTPQKEICGNSKDDDCDGFVDEGCQCQLGQTRPCGIDRGECRRGFQVCTSGRWDTRCLNGSTPQPETCDRKDNDCDGRIDEELTRPCTSTCGPGTQTCSFGRWRTCRPPVTSSEICDGKDNDCDGRVDENLTRSCYTGPTGTSGVGECKSGISVCSSGAWKGCSNQVVPSKEVCGDGKDNDCDGTIDEQCVCTPGDVRDCGTDAGDCKKGKQTCSGNRWGVCVGSIGPQVEICDGRDNDCNGRTDDVAPTSCSTACGTGSRRCFSGRWFCTAPQPRPEQCGNGVDDNCNGQIDETCPCKTGETRPCGKSTGACKPGLQHCVGGQWSTTCQGGVQPTNEVCDNIDNDCDGQVDENGVCNCKEGAKRACYTGPASTRNRGECKDGSQLCRQGRWEKCVGSLLPKPETCDNKDNNCNGQIDESITPQSCYSGPKNTHNVGVCKSGTRTCKAGAWSLCVNEVTPRPEKCGDGLDNDCDGQSEEGCPCKPGEKRACGPPAVGSCKRGVQACANGAWGDCLGVVGPTSEVCDGKDNDCDGQVDENNPGGGGGCTVPQAQGPCAKGLRACVKGSIVCQSSVTPKPEVCNKIDDDCDGRIDENACPVCKEGEKRPCYTGPQGTKDVGLCKAGVELCVKGQWSKVCTGQSVPTQDLCDGQDNNCNGRTDEGIADRPCTTPCGVGKRQCLKGSWTPCLGPQPSPEVCDGVDNNCNGKIDDNAACPPGLSCQVGKCIPPILPDAGPEGDTPDVTPGCNTDADCPSDHVCRENLCIRKTQPDASEQDPPENSTEQAPETTQPDQIVPSKLCKVNGDCDASSVCRWGRCVIACVTDQTCQKSAQGHRCLLGLCVSECVVDKHCVNGFVCRGGTCSAGCRKDDDCTNGDLCVGASCVSKCKGDTDCKANEGVCSPGEYCLPRCTLNSDCPVGFTCTEGTCKATCAAGVQGRSCKENQVCSAGRCTDDCSRVKCSSSTSQCEKNVCVSPCSQNSECAANQACFAGKCVARCSTQSDCRAGSNCSDGVCRPVCTGNQDCASGFSCVKSRCVAACASGEPPAPIDAGVTPDQVPSQSCSSSQEMCSGETCLTTCSKASDCETGYGCGAACFGCTQKVCLPACRLDADCPNKYYCDRGLCSLGCINDQQCAQGERCNAGRCERSCSKDTDCPQPQLCKKSICTTPEPIGPGGLPKLKLAGGCGCETTGNHPASWAWMVILLVLLLPVARRKWKSIQ